MTSSAKRNAAKSKFTEEWKCLLTFCQMSTLNIDVISNTLSHYFSMPAFIMEKRKIPSGV